MEVPLSGGGDNGRSNKDGSSKIDVNIAGIDFNNSVNLASVDFIHWPRTTNAEKNEKEIREKAPSTPCLSEFYYIPVVSVQCLCTS